MVFLGPSHFGVVMVFPPGAAREAVRASPFSWHSNMPICRALALATAWHPIGTANILLAGAKYHFANYPLFHKLLNTVAGPILGPNPLKSPFQKAEQWGFIHARV